MSEDSKQTFFTRSVGRLTWRARVACCAVLLACVLSACEAPTNTQNTNTSNTTANTAASPAAQNAQGSQTNAVATAPVTLPVLDAMFSDETFAAELKQKLGLTDEQVARLRDAAREATSSLSETATAETTGGSTTDATKRAQEQIRGIVGDEKAGQLAQFVSERWASGTGEEKASNAASGAPASASSDRPNNVPTDTRIVVNAPAYRMDLFQNGQLVRSYKVGIGYPEFPLPTGMRKASNIIFNPTWTPPDEPWVRGKLKPGQQVAAGSSMNPLGPIKIPIGSPSLIHGGKSPARLGTFASHGCVGLTNPQVQDFSLALAELSGTRLTEQDILGYAKNKTQTQNVKLSNTITVELRYETIVVEDGKLKIYRDVYERGTNTEENLRRVLEANGVSFDQLSEDEKKQALEGLQQMARNAQGKSVGGAPASNSNNQNASNGNQSQTNRSARNQSRAETRSITGKKEIVIEIAALKGKGYPVAVELNTGGKSKRPLSAAANNNAQGNTNQSNAGATNGNTDRPQTNTATTNGRR